MKINHKIALSAACAITAMMFAAPTAATAATVLSDNFNGENGGLSALNYTGFANFTVIAPPGGGTVDIVRNGDYGISCAGGSGSCIDLDGTTNSAAGIQTLTAFAFNAGQRVTLSFDFSGNQRGGADDAIFFGFEALGSIDFLDAVASNSGGSLSLGDLLGAPSLVFGFGGILATDPFDRMSFSFTAGTAGSVRGIVGDASANPQNPVTDNQGVIIDNFQISVESPVPEPASWLMMMAGFGMLGAAIRRRSAQALISA